jgi:hypothetical protein
MRISNICTTKCGGSLTKNLSLPQSAPLSVLYLPLQETSIPIVSAPQQIHQVHRYLVQEALLPVLHVRSTFFAFICRAHPISSSAPPAHAPETRTNIEPALSPTTQRRLRPLPLPPGAVLSPVSGPADPHASPPEATPTVAVANTSRPGTANVDG